MTAEKSDGAAMASKSAVCELDEVWLVHGLTKTLTHTDLLDRRRSGRLLRKIGRRMMRVSLKAMRAGTSRAVQVGLGRYDAGRACLSCQPMCLGTEMLGMYKINFSIFGRIIVAAVCSDCSSIAYVDAIRGGCVYLRGNLAATDSR